MDLANFPTTRAEAKASGATHYFTGKPCKHGHVAPRLTKGTCSVCLEVEWKRSNDRRKGLPKSEAAKAAGRKYYHRNKKLVARKAKAQEREKINEYKRRWKKRNAEQQKLYTNMRRRRLRDATPKWLTPKDKEEIRNIYQKAARWTKETGVSYVVDHVIPLQSSRVCGLHVPDNLQVITRAQNTAKGSSFN